MALKKFASVFWLTLAMTGAWDNVSNEDISLFFGAIELAE